MEWTKYPTYFRANTKQKSLDWKKLRYCCLNSSDSSKWSGRANPMFVESPEIEALYICGIKEKEFSPLQIENMNIGNYLEPFIVKWYGEQNNLIIPEVGVSVWKKDFRFRSSLDIDPGEEYDFFGEVKAPKFLYRPLIEHMEAIKKGFKPPPFYHRHIYDNHYDQMTTSAIIHNRKFADYVVVSAETKQSYIERLKIDEDHWNNVLYPKGCLFYDTYITPLMKQYSLTRIDPK
jgi:hypothetical protein